MLVDHPPVDRFILQQFQFWVARASGRVSLCCILMATLEFQPPMTLSHRKLAFEYVKEVVGTTELRLIKKVTPMQRGTLLHVPWLHCRVYGVGLHKIVRQFQNWTSMLTQGHVDLHIHVWKWI